MIEGARQLAIHHLTVRVPWHDAGWQGTICENPCGNTSCTVLPRIAESRDDTLETELAGQSLETLEPQQLPPCVDEHGTFMAPFSLSLRKNHPYAASAPTTHGHFAPTLYTIQPYSAAVVPFRWMLREQVEGNNQYNIQAKAETYQLGYDANREPDLTQNPGWNNDPQTWIQEGTNQRTLLDTFFSAVKPEESLVFFYAKRTPLSEDPQRVIVGVGRVKTVGEPTEYQYSNGECPAKRIRGFLWERNVEHSIRPEPNDGFLLPYRELLACADEDDSLDIASCTAFAPDEYFEQYSYGSELLPQDGAIASLLALEKSIKAMRTRFDAPWETYLQWIDRELNRLWQARGAFPGLGASLHAFGFSHGNLLAWYIAGEGGEEIDPWNELSATLANPDPLPEYLRQEVGPIMRQMWVNLLDERRNLLILLARFNLTNDQARRWYDPIERENSGIQVVDDEILANPYRIFEEDRFQPDPIGFGVIDRGGFPPEIVRQNFPLPEPTRVEEAIDQRRVRAVMVQTLEEAATEGHTFLPLNWLIVRVRARPMKPECPLDADTLQAIDFDLAPLIQTVNGHAYPSGFQLKRFVDTASLIRQKVENRREGHPNAGDFNWNDLVNQAIGDGPINDFQGGNEQNAREEKAAALEVLYRSRISVLIGSAGTGKSTLIKALCQIQQVHQQGILLLAPTGKARVRLEQASGQMGEGKTIAQFLLGLQRYDGNTGRYYINDEAPKSSGHKTVVIDECSMMTEEQFAALLNAIAGVDRLILVGDPRQLPPIGAGRPFVDIVEYLTPANIESLSPRVETSYAELTVPMRQQPGHDEYRPDVLLADAFSGAPKDPGADEVWNSVVADNSPFVKLVRWMDPNQLQELLVDELIEELSLNGGDEEVGFEQSIGGVASEFNGRINVFFNTKTGHGPGASEKAEDWQILTPVRQNQMGVLALNRAIQKRFRRSFLDFAGQNGNRRKIPKPAGPEGIIYGDKVINIRNSGRRRVFPTMANPFVANGDIGIVTGHRRTRNRDWYPNQVEVEMAAQPGCVYKYNLSEFNNQESAPPLELAYALTVHKTQGSEFDLTLLVVPNPCRLLSRELLYTALTRHRTKVVILHQGDFFELQRYAHAGASEIARRMTNLFHPSNPVEITVRDRAVCLDDNLIYRTERGDLVRSKSEWIIADKLHRSGIDYQYEQPIQLDGVERLPDFTIVDDDRGRTWYWEHNGLLDRPDYRVRWERKLAGYRNEGIFPIEEGVGPNGTLLTTGEQQGEGLDADAIDRNINAILGV